MSEYASRGTSSPERFLPLPGLAFPSFLALMFLVAACSDPAPAPAEGESSSTEFTSSESADVGIPEEYAAEVDAWHAERIDRLRADTGWLTLVGLFWLEEGDNTFGSAEDNDLVFPEKAPARAGTLRLEDGKVSLTAADGVEMRHDGEAVSVLPMASDASGEETRVELGSLRFYVLDREGRIGIRLKDVEAPILQTFTGIDRFPLDPQWRIEARWEAYDPPKMVFTPNVLGSAFEEECPGALVLTVNEQEYHLEPTSSGDGSLFLVFGDATNGESTYGGGRFLVLPAPENGKILADFNRAYNPPCVFTPYATCPLPRKENRVPFEIPAGEKMWGEPHDV